MREHSTSSLGRRRLTGTLMQLLCWLAVIAGVVDFVVDRRIRQLRSAWIHALGNALVISLSVINVFVHSRDGYTAVVPTGIVLSGFVVLIMMITGWMSGEMVNRHRVGVTD